MVKLASHGKRYCQYGYYHGQCRCAKSHQQSVSIMCDVPKLHGARPALELDEGQAGWIDPPPPPPHNCRDHWPLVVPSDKGRRWRCSCGKVFLLRDVEYDQRDHDHYGIWEDVTSPTDFDG